MFRPIPEWTRFVWNIFSVMSIDHGAWQTVCSLLLIASSVYTFLGTPETVCQVEGNCDHSLTTIIKGMFTRIVSVTELVSRLVIVLKGNGQLAEYKKNLDNFHAFTPMTRSEASGLDRFASRVVAGCMLLILPINVFRLWLLSSLTTMPLGFFVLVYAQNFSMNCVETHFVVLCFVLYQKFVGINRDLTALKINTILRNRYPFVSRKGEKYGGGGGGGGCVRATTEYNADVLSSLAAGHPVFGFIEKLKAKHRLVREAVKNLSSTFGVHLGLSLCSLCLYAMFDLYYHLAGVWNASKSKMLIYGWLLQYAVRFLLVIILAHMTTKQAHKSKILITDINNRYLDSSTKEELQLFHNQISSCSIEFTACDFFTLNTHLITSAIAAGTTYLVILLQFNS